MDSFDLILLEIQSMRKEMNAGFLDTKQRITAVETVVEPFFATDGGKEKIERDIKDLNKWKYYVIGGAGVLSTLIHYIAKKIGL